ncbi:hypothetical protein IV203_030657 [Nitzschia inconspicua]|uniref:ERCC4 domain-containing protein n=1 Tax=Nitzschia inconspicua TaxID=303405 RepID=A0A9K3LTW5_9STRA|nr:hypothetical protein IV203_030657 [Nitzschia inconspicua]
MEDSRKGKKRLPPPPQLARPCYSVDSSSSSSDEENSIPIKNKSNKTIHSNQISNVVNSSSNSNNNNDYDDRDDNDDSSLEILPPNIGKQQQQQQKPLVCPIKSERRQKNQTNNTRNVDKQSQTGASTNKVEIIDLLHSPPRSLKESSTITTNEQNNQELSINGTNSEKPLLSSKLSSTTIHTASLGTTGTTTNSMLNKTKPYTFSSSSSSSSSDDEDDNLLLSKPTFETRDQIKQRKKREREAQQEQERNNKARKRQEEREARQRQKQDEKAAKKRKNEAFNQTNGKYRHDEIAILMDPFLFDNDVLGLVQMLSGDFLVHSYPSNLSMAPAAVQFIRKDFLHGGAKDAIDCLKKGQKDKYQHIQDLVLVVEANDFIPMLQRQEKTEDDDYPKLEQWLVSIQSKWQQVWHVSPHVQPRMLLLLRNVPETLDKMWVQHRRRSQADTTSLPTAWELHDAIQWLLVQFQVECMHCPNEDFIQLILHKMARAICQKPYKNHVSELECVRKIKHGPNLVTDNPVDRVKDVWLRQLQSIQGLSLAMAQNVVDRYPTCQSLWQAYQELQQNENSSPALLLADILAPGRSQQKLSRAVFQILTSNNPGEMIL